VYAEQEDLELQRLRTLFSSPKAITHEGLRIGNISRSSEKEFVFTLTDGRELTAILTQEGEEYLIRFGETVIRFPKTSLLGKMS